MTSFLLMELVIVGLKHSLKHAVGRGGEGMQRASTPSRGGGAVSCVYRGCFESSQGFGCGGRVVFLYAVKREGAVCTADIFLIPCVSL